MINPHLVIRHDVKITQGALRSLIIDLANSKYFLVPLSFEDFVINSNYRSTDEIINQYKSKERIIAKEYIDWLLKENLAFLIPEKLVDSFKAERKTSIDAPYTIQDCILETNEYSKSIFPKIIDKIEQIRVPHLELRIFFQISFADFNEFLFILQESSFLSVIIYLQYSEWCSKQFLESQLIGITVIEKIIIYGAPTDDEQLIQDSTTQMLFVTANITNNSCGVISPKYFFPNSNFYFTFRQSNSCLSKKLSIKANGDIQNCPSMKYSFGNILNDSVEKIINSASFRKLWQIEKQRWTFVAHVNLEIYVKTVELSFRNPRTHFQSR